MENQTTELTVVLSTELEAVVNQNTSIEPTKAQAHALSFAPSMVKVHELSKALTIMDKTNPTDSDSKIAKRMRLDLVDVRKRAEEIKTESKEMIITEGKLIDKLFGVVKEACQLTELEYASIEKFAENKEKERKQKLFSERSELLSSVCENPSIYPLGDFDEETFNNLYEGLKLAKQAKIDAELKAESDRIEAEKQAELERLEAKRIADEKAEAQRLENIRLKADKEKADKAFEAAAVQAKFEAEEKEKAHKAQLLKAENERKEEAKKQAEIQAKKDAELKKQQAEKAELERQLQAKKDAELKAENERKAKDLAEEKAKKELLKSGDKSILNNWIDGFNINPIETKGLSKDGILKANEIFSKFQAFQKWSKEQAENI